MEIIKTFKNIENSNNYYIIEFNDSIVVIDPPRDAWKVLNYSSSTKKPITHILETHIHNDYLTGAFEIANVHNSIHVVPEPLKKSNFQLADSNFEINVEGYSITSLPTPGHTYTHVSYVLEKEGTTVAIFSGGSVTSNGVGRTDLISPADTSILTHHQFESKNKFHEFDDKVFVYPTHGQGSFCGVTNKPLPDYPTIESLKIDNALFVEKDYKNFEQNLLSSLGAYPSYFGTTNNFNLGDFNLISNIETPQVITDMEIIDDVVLVDATVDKNFKVQDAIKIPNNNKFSSYVGWIINNETPLALVFEDREIELFNIDNLTNIYDNSQLNSDKISQTILSLYRVGIEKIKYIIPQSAVKKLKTSTITKETYNGEKFYDIREKNEKNSDEEFSFDILSRHYYQNGSLPSKFLNLNENYLSCGSGLRAGLIASIINNEKTIFLNDTSVDSLDK